MTFDQLRGKELEPIVRDIPKPGLLHRQGGLGRTGLASAIFMHRECGMDIEAAEGQISLHLGHFGIRGISRAHLMDEAWGLLEDLQLASAREADS